MRLTLVRRALRLRSYRALRIVKLMEGEIVFIARTNVDTFASMDRLDRLDETSDKVFRRAVVDYHNTTVLQLL